MKKEDFRKFEMKLYELLGVKLFRKLAFAFRNIVWTPLVLDIPKEKRKDEIKKRCYNYNIRSIREEEDLNKHKKWIYLNALIHVSLFIRMTFELPLLSATSDLYKISYAIIFILNTEAIMLQRYTMIKVNIAKEHLKPYFERKRIREEKKIKDLDEKFREHEYRLSDSKGLSKILSYEELIANSSMEELCRYRDYLEHLKLYLEGDVDLTENITEHYAWPIGSGKRLTLVYKKTNTKKD